MGCRAFFVKAIGWWLILAGVGLTRSQVQEGEDSSATAILALEHAWSAAEAHNDNLALERIFDNALVKIEDGRLVTKGECLSRVRLKGSNPRQIVVNATTVHIFGSTAIVAGTYRETSVKNGQTLQRQWRFIDTWVNKKDGWILVASGASPQTR